MAIKIRLMKKEDLSSLARIYVAVYKQLPVNEQWTLASAKELISYWLKKQPDLAFVALIDRKLVGAFVTSIKPWWDGNHLSDGEMFVHPTHQKLGIGTLLSKALYKKALQKYNVTAFDAFIFKNTSFPLSWYKSLGFKVNNDWVIISGDVRTILARLQSPKPKS